MEYKYLDHQGVMDILPERKVDAHKGDFGKLLLLCGSRGYTGAAALAAMGALRMGAGLVYLGVPECIYAIEATKLLEPIVLPLPDEGGKLADDALQVISELLSDKDAVLIGPGLGQSAGIRNIVSVILKVYEGPIVLDADGINVLRAHRDILRGRTGPTVLTPHEGEFSRIFPERTGDRMADATTFAREFGVILLLKGHRTLITDGRVCYVNQTGNSGMAVGGSGDVLAGMITSLIGQGVEPLEAAAAGAWLHGAAGDLCASQMGQYGMLPSDMLTVLPRLLK